MMRQTQQQYVAKRAFKLNKQVELLKEKNGRLQKKIKELSDKNRILSAENKKLSKSNREKDRQLTSAGKKTGQMTKNVSIRDKKIQKMSEYISKLQGKIKESAKKISDLKMQHGQEMKAVHQMYYEIMNPEQNRVSDEVQRINEENKALKKKSSELEKRVNANDGPHTPSSKKPLASKSRNKPTRKKSGRKQGAQKGHKGKYHKYDKPTETQCIKLKRCNKKDCRCKKLKETHTETVLVEEITKPQKKTIKCIVSYYECLKCGEKDMRKDDPLLRNGRYGPNVVLQVAINHLGRMPHRMNAEHLAILAGIIMSVGTVHDKLKKLGSRLMAPANVLMQAMQRARILHVDETSISLNGKLVWVWIFFDPKSGNVLFTIRKSRGQNVPNEILGPDWKGTLVVDGWVAYLKYIVQRCNAHLIREVRDVAEKNEDDEAVARALTTFQAILRDAKRRTKKQERVQLFDSVTQRIKRMISKYRTHPLLKKPMEKIERALPDMFRFVLNPKIASDNNAAERPLREISIHRKVRGCIRSEETMDWMGALFTCVATWKAKGLDYVAELAKYV